MNIWILMGIGLILLVVVWRLNIRANVVRIDLPADPHAYVKPEYAPLIDWLAEQAESQIGGGHDIARNPLALSTLNEALERAMADRGGDGSIEISIPGFVTDATGRHGFRLRVGRSQLEAFNV